MYGRLTILAVLLCLACSFTILQRKSAIKQDWPFSICGDGDWSIDSVDITPRPAKGVNCTITVSGTATTDTTFNDMYLNVKLNGVGIHNQTNPFARSYAEGDSISYIYENPLPSYIPSGTYTLTLQFRKKNQANNGCMQFSFKIIALTFHYQLTSGANGWCFIKNVCKHHINTSWKIVHNVRLSPSQHQENQNEI